MKLLRTLLPVVALLALPSVGLAPRLAADDTDSATLYKKVLDSCVFIVTPLEGGAASGSGSLLDAEKRYILTNYHVVEEVSKIFVQFPVHNKDGSILTDKKQYIERIPAGLAMKGTVLFRDKTRDLAIVQLDRLPATAVPIKLAKKSVDVGERTWNIGSPGAVHHVFSITGGEIRAVGMEDLAVGGGGEVLRIKAKMVTATNPTNPGDSGGPLFNKHGEQVAVTESGNTRAQNVNLFVDVSEVWGFLKEKKIELKQNERPPEPKGPDKKYGIDGHKPKKDTIVPEPKTDAPGTTPPAKKADPTPDPATPPAASPEDEKKAAELLSQAKLFEDDDKEYFAAKLKKIVAQYPATAAGKEAKKLLDALK